MPTTRIRYVNTNSSGGNGTTNNTSGASAAYASLFALEAAERVNLVSGDLLLSILCDGTAVDTTAVTFAASNWTSDSTRKIVIQPNTNSIHAGVYDTNKYRLEPSGGNGLLVDTVFLDIVGLQIGSTSSGTSCIYFYSDNNTATTNLVSRCIIGSAAGAARHGLKVLMDTNGRNKTFIFVNNTVYGLKGAIVDIADGCKAVVYNNTIIDPVVGIELADSNRASTNPTFLVKNNIIDNSSLFDYGDFTSASTVTTANNFTGDATSPDGHGSKTFTFVDASADNYHLSASDSSGARTGGSDLSADSDYAFNVDIDNDLRSGSWMAGSDQIVTPQTVGVVVSIRSGERLGNAAVAPGAVSVVPKSIATAERVQSASIVRYVTPTAIPSAERHGLHAISRYVSNLSIGSAERFGAFTATPGAVNVAPLSIGSNERVGNSEISFVVLPKSVLTGERIGNLALSLNLSIKSILPSDRVANAVVEAITGQIVAPAGIAGLGLFGQQSLALSLTPGSVRSAEMFGNPTSGLYLTARSIASAERVATAVPSFVLAPGSIRSAERVGFSSSTIFVAPFSIFESAHFGNQAVVLIITPAGIRSSENFGPGLVSIGDAVISPRSILTGEHTGSILVSIEAGSAFVTVAAKTRDFAIRVQDRVYSIAAHARAFTIRFRR